MRVRSSRPSCWHAEANSCQRRGSARCYEGGRFATTTVVLRAARLTALTALVAAACGAEVPDPPSPPAVRSTTGFDWPVPAGWKHETIPFPLGFAPGLPFHGVEELRFAPGFFD